MYARRRGKRSEDGVEMEGVIVALLDDSELAGTLNGGSGQVLASTQILTMAVPDTAPVKSSIRRSGLVERVLDERSDSEVDNSLRDVVSNERLRETIRGLRHKACMMRKCEEDKAHAPSFEVFGCKFRPRSP